MIDVLSEHACLGVALPLAGILASLWAYLLVFIGFSLVIFVHELGHFMAAKLCRVRVDKFAVGFGRAIVAYRKGIGICWGSAYPRFRQRVDAYIEQTREQRVELDENGESNDPEIAVAARELGIGETEYCFNILPLGGYVKMLGQEDFAVDKSGELKVKADPRAFTNKPIGQRMFIVSAGVVMNLVFAAFIFMVAFMIGIKSPSAEIGEVMPGTPADKAGLRVGDTITKIDGRKIADRQDLSAAVVLSDPDRPLTIAFLRTDPVTQQRREHTVSVRPEQSADQVLKIGVAPPLTTTVSSAWNEPGLRPEEYVQAGDRIVAVNGKPVKRFDEVKNTLEDLRGQWAELTIHRAGATEQSAGQDLIVRRRAHLFFIAPSGKFDQEAGHLLGLAPRVRISDVFEHQRGEVAGLQRGDVIVRWGNVSAPRLDEILKSIKENPETDISVTVLRGTAENKTLTVRPKGPGWLSKSDPQIGIQWFAQDTDHLVIADVVTNVSEDLRTPAAALKTQIPRGAVLTKVNDEAVATWYDLAQRFTKLAGTQVRLTWRYENQPEQSASIYVPQTIGTTFDLSARHVITAINGVSEKEVTVDGRRATLSANNWLGARDILRDCIGQTVEIKYQGFGDPTPRTAQLTVTPEMLDTWTMRTLYMVDDVSPGVDFTLVRETNPVKAMMIGVQKTYYFIEQVYITMQRMIITRSMGVEQVSGPVGIIKMGSDFAAAGLPILLYFLALISANLAVINFLPLPIVDGGLFLFLLIEKIKGSPISIRVQVATQVIGLALIIGIFLFVTFQDLQKLFG